MSEPFYWGSKTAASQISGMGFRVGVDSENQILQGTRVNTSEIDRTTQQGQQKIKLSDFSGGLTRYAGIGSSATNITQYAYSELVTRIPGLLYLPYKPTIDTSTLSANISGTPSRTTRMHSVMTAYSGSNFYWTGFYGPNYLYSPSGTVLSAMTGTNNATATATMQLGSTVMTVIATDGSTDHVQGTHTLSLGIPTFSQVMTYPAGGDKIVAMKYFPDLHANMFVGKWNGVVGLWWCNDTDSTPITTLDPVVDKATATEFLPPDNAANVGLTFTTAEKYPGLVYAILGRWASPGPAPVTWTTPANAEVQDGTNFAVWTASTNANTSNLISENYDFNIPDSARIIGIQCRARVDEHNAGDNVYWNTMNITGGYDQIPSQAELATSLTDYTVGSTTDPMGLSITGKNVNDPTFGFYIAFNPSVDTAVINVDSMAMTIAYQLPGTPTVINLGSSVTGYAGADMPNFPDRFVYVDQSQAASDRLLYIDVEKDAANNRPVATVTAPYTGLNTIWHTAAIAGGLAVAGLTSEIQLNAGAHQNTLADTVILIKSDGTPLDLQIPKSDGLGHRWFVNKLETVETYLRAEMVSMDGTGTVLDQQYWLWDSQRKNPAWFTDSELLTSTGTSVSTFPVAWAETTLDLLHSTGYTFWPVSNTHIGVRAEFVPDDLNADPRLLYTEQKLAPGPLYLQTMEMTSGYEEASNTVVEVNYQERHISNSSQNLGTVRYQMDTDGDVGFTVTPVDKTFDTGYSSTIAGRGTFDVAGGQAYQTQIHRITLTQGAGSTTGSPNGLSILITQIQQWPDLSVYRIAVDVHNAMSSKDYYTLIDDIYTLKQLQNARPLRMGSIANVNGVMAAFEGVSMQAMARMPAFGNNANPDFVDDKGNPIYPVLTFRQVPGSVT